ncbi:MAG: protein kinase [Caldilineales bacterium]|nr:protein kinase [Caldilineales bacterium]MDW8317994.1 protein kinase [Anaerolineae bacterium]
MATDAVALPPTLVESIVRRRCVLFLGPDAAETADGYLGLPTSGQLALELAERCGHRGGYKPLPQIAQIYTHSQGRHSLVSYLRQRLDQPIYRPLPVHELTARIPFRTVVQAGWDRLLEQCLDRHGAAYSVVYSAVEALHQPADGRLIVYKPYGDVDRPDAMVITEDDQLDVFYQLQGLKRRLADLVAHNALLLVGYAADYDSVLVRIYHEIRHELRDHRMPAFVVGAVSRPQDAAQWEARGFQPVGAKPVAFLYALATAVAEAEGRKLALPPVEHISQAPRATPADLAALAQAVAAVYDRLGIGELVEGSDVLLLTPDQVRDVEAVRGAYERLAAALPPEPGSAQVWLRQGNVEFARRNYDAARRLYQQALAVEPAMAEAHYNLHHVHLQLGEWEAALEAYQRAAALRPDLAMLPARYRIDGVLGRGGVGVVYRAADTLAGRPVAVKLLDRSLMRTEAALRRFRREAELLQRLDHPHIVRYLDFQQHQGRYFLAMEYLGPHSLAAVLAERGRLGLDEVDRIVQQACDALSFAHGQGIVHRDLKPSNVFLVEGEVKLIDFGLAVDLAAGQPSAVELPAGTAAYLAPEQAMGGPVDARTDVYALGTLAYELLTGVNPGQGAYRPVDELAPGVTPALEIVLARARAREPAQRYATAEEFRRAWTAVMPTQPAFQDAPAWRRGLGRLQAVVRTAVARYWPAWLALVLLLGLAYPAPVSRLGLLLALALVAVLLTDWYTLWLGRRSSDPLLPTYGPLIGLLLAVALWLPPAWALAPGDITAGATSFLDYLFVVVIHLAVALAFGSLALLALGMGMAVGRRLGLAGAGRMAVGLALAALPMALHALFYLANF